MVILCPTDISIYHPEIAMAPDGSFVVAGENEGLSDPGIFAHRFDAQGNPLGVGP